MSSTDTPAVAVAAAASGEIDAVLTKVQKHLDLLKGKNAKLQEENAKLRAALTEARAAHSRIRRIPKPAKAAA